MDNKTAEQNDVVVDQLKKALNLIAERRKTNTGLLGIHVYVDNALYNYRLNLNQTEALREENEKLRADNERMRERVESVIKLLREYEIDALNHRQKSPTQQGRAYSDGRHVAYEVSIVELQNILTPKD